jgi:hypothetical protein
MLQLLPAAATAAAAVDDRTADNTLGICKLPMLPHCLRMMYAHTTTTTAFSGSHETALTYTGYLLSSTQTTTTTAYTLLY